MCPIALRQQHDEAIKERDAARRELCRFGHGISPRGTPMQMILPAGRVFSREELAEISASRGWSYLYHEEEKNNG